MNNRFGFKDFIQIVLLGAVLVIVSLSMLQRDREWVLQRDVLEKGVDVLIATPGRLLDLVDRGRVLLADCKVLVIDEISMLDARATGRAPLAASAIITKGA
jgi:superfamily II DNA/RNA helicase